MSQTPEWDRNEWQQIQTKIDKCDILLLCTSVWLGEKGSVCNRVLERMDGYTHLVNGKGSIATMERWGQHQSPVMRRASNIAP